MGSKLDRRRQDIYRARDRSKAAQNLPDIGENVALADSVAQQGLGVLDGNTLAGTWFKEQKYFGSTSS